MTSVIDRRAFLGTVAGELLSPSFAVEAQPAAKVYRVGLLGEQASDPSEARLWQGSRLETSWLDGSWTHIPAPEREARP